MAATNVVFYFGGFKSTQKDMDAWTASATDQAGDQFSFKAFPYPASAGSDDVDAVKGFGVPEISRLAQCIKDDPDRRYVIVGHSSGCAISNAVAEKAAALQGGKAKNFRLVALDGFRPSKDLFAKMDIKCWSAKNGANKARNWSAMAAAGSNFKVYEPGSDCGKEPWCLHFSLVNENATDEAVKKIWQGYANCKANLVWLKD